jgi:RNA polymerase sigma factor (sigma-70 family)
MPRMPDHAAPQTRDLGPDRKLVARLVARENDAWGEFHQQVLPRIRACVRQAGVRDDLVDDACSFVVEALLADDCRRLRQWDGRASLTTYLYTVASRLAVDFIRQQPRVIFAGEEAIPHTDPLAPAVQEAEERALHAGLREKILHCLLRIPIGADRDILMLRYFLGLAVQEIALSYGKTRNATDQALLRAHRHLRRIAEGMHPEILDYLPEDTVAASKRPGRAPVRGTRTTC